MHEILSLILISYYIHIIRIVFINYKIGTDILILISRNTITIFPTIISPTSSNPIFIKNNIVSSIINSETTRSSLINLNRFFF